MMMMDNQLSRFSRLSCLSLFNLTASLKSLSKSFNLYPTKSPSSHLPTFIWALFLTRSSTLPSSSLAMISPAVLRQVGLAISSFMASILVYSFWRVSLNLTKSPARRSSCDFMYYLMYFSPSLKASSMIDSNRSLRPLN